jgi:hypothetical protein
MINGIGQVGFIDKNCSSKFVSTPRTLLTQSADVCDFSYKKQKKSEVVKNLASVGVTLLAATHLKKSSSLLNNDIIKINKLCKIAQKENISKSDGFDELKKLRVWDNFKNLEMNNSFSEEESKILFKGIGMNNGEFFATLSGQKPSCIIGYDENLEFIEKLKNTKLGQNLDFAHVQINNGQFKNTYVFNKSELAKIIENNKSLYATRLNLPQNSSIDNIYKTFIEGLKNGKISSACSGGENMQDLVGISLGYPRTNSMIFNLERVDDLNYLLRNNNSKFKMTIKDIFNSNKSPYKNLEKKDMDLIKKGIENINIESSRNNGAYNTPIYSFVNFVDEPQELQRIEQNTLEFKNNFSIKEFDKMFL